MKNERKRHIVLLSFYSLFGAWKIVGIWQWRVIGVLNIIWRKTEMEQKSDRERWGDGGADGEREREREREMMMMMMMMMVYYLLGYTACKAVYKTSEIQHIMDTKGGPSSSSLTWQ